MKIWLSKYALSNGITEHECAPPAEGEEYIQPGAPFMSFVSFKLGRHAHMTREAAVTAAEAERLKKIKSLRKQIARLEKLQF